MKVYILVGCPGSGKSTLAKSSLSHLKRISQDANGGDKALTRKQFIEALQSGNNVVVDRCNMTRGQRREWVNLALYHGVSQIHCIVLDADPEECVHRVNLRPGHETISREMPLDKKREIVYRFYNSFEDPSLDEGFSSITKIRG